MYKLLVAYVDRRSKVIRGRWSRLHAFGGKRGSSFTSLWWHTLIVVHKPFVANVDRHSQAFGGRGNHSQAFGGRRGSSFAGLVGIRGSPCISFW